MIMTRIITPLTLNHTKHLVLALSKVQPAYFPRKIRRSWRRFGLVGSGPRAAGWLGGPGPAGARRFQVRSLGVLLLPFFWENDGKIMENLWKINLWKSGWAFGGFWLMLMENQDLRSVQWKIWMNFHGKWMNMLMSAANKMGCKDF